MRWAVESRGRRISEFEASLVYRVSSRTVRATQRNAVSKKKKKSGHLTITFINSVERKGDTETDT